MPLGPLRRQPAARTFSVPSARWLSPGGLGLLLPLLMHWAGAVAPAEADRLLKRADLVKIGNHSEFTVILKSLEDESRDLSLAQREYLHYLEGWKSAYDGDYEAAIAKLEAFIPEARNATLRFRAGTTVINVLELAAHYERAFARLSRLLEQLPEVSDGDAREQALLVAAQLYNDVGQYDLSLHYAQMLIDENWAGRGVCKGGDQRLRSLYESSRLKAVGPDLQAGIDSCVAVGESGYTITIRIYAAKLYIDQQRFDDAIKLLSEHYDAVRQTQSPRLISEYESLLARAYEEKGDVAQARRFASNAIDSAVKNAYTEPLITAYRVLYKLAKQQDDYKLALAFHERYTAADKGYLDDVSARQLAYQKVNHENIANKLQVDALNKQNHVLQLERELSAKAVETSRLYIVLLAMTVVFIGLWAYKTKRSQLHFMSLSQMDGLTGICNRPYFIEQADKALEYSRKTGQHACLVLFDLDHFKAVNDKYGHATGDYVLKRAVSACKNHLRKSDVFGRFGGEEFAVLLPGCELDEARRHSDQLRATIASISADQDSAKATISASFGVASTSTSGYELRQLLAHADAALYQAKRAGRNRVVLYGSVEEVTPLTAPATDDRAALPGRPSIRM
jgi:diguanylate cyclase (GGDEF)-like protein